MLLEAIRIRVESLAICHLGLDVHDNLFTYPIGNGNAINKSFDLNSILLDIRRNFREINRGRYKITIHNNIHRLGALNIPNLLNIGVYL